MTQGTQPKISFQDVTRRFGDGETSFLALDRLNLDIADGEFVTVVGPSGCGKSTAMNIAAGLLDVTDGRVLVGEVEAADVQLQWRGPLAFMAWRDPAGRRMRLAWWPDTLPSRWRRELRLAADRACTARRRPSVAP